MRAQCGLERVGVLAAVPADLELDEDGEVEAQRPRVEQRAVGPDDAGRLELPDAPQAGRGRQPDPLRQLDVRQPAVLLEGGQDAPVDRVEGWGWHVVLPQARMAAGYANNRLLQTRVRKDMPRPPVP